MSSIIINKKNIAITLFLASLAYFLFFCRFGILFQDEGYFNIRCIRMLSGELPYKDFFLHTPPIAYFLQALIFKIFGNALIVGRISTAVLGAFITLLIFLVSSRISSVIFSIIPSVLFIFWGVSHIPYPSFNWMGLLLGLSVVLLFTRSIETGSKPCIIFSGFLSSFLFFTKQNLGVAAFAAICGFFILEKILNPKEKIFPGAAYFAAGAFIGVFPVINHAYTTGILPGMVYYVFGYGYKSGMMRADFFPFPHIVPASFLIGGFYALTGLLAYRLIVKKKTVYGIILAFIAASAAAAYHVFKGSSGWYYALDHIKEGAFNGFFNLPALSIILIFVMPGYLIFRKRRVSNAREKMALFLAIFALIYIWAGLFAARDYVHLIPTMPIAYVLYGYLLERSAKFLFKNINKTFTAIYCFVLPVIFLCGAGLTANLMNETFRFSSSPLIGMTARVEAPDAEHILATHEESKVVSDVVRSIRDNTEKNDGIFCLHACETFYILSERRCASFYTFFIPNAFGKSDQARVISDLDAGNTKLVLAQKDLMGVSHGGGISDEIEKYVREKYYIKDTIGNYYIFIRKPGAI